MNWNISGNLPRWKTGSHGRRAVEGSGLHRSERHLHSPGTRWLGLCAHLMMEVIERIRDRGETPFLHVRKDNERAIKLYQRLGFSRRSLSHLAVLRKDSLN
jgi:predicted GNAT family acetyltransferase